MPLRLCPFTLLEAWTICLDLAWRRWIGEGGTHLVECLGVILDWLLLGARETNLVSLMFRRLRHLRFLSSI